jgi:hypothetical protein
MATNMATREAVLSPSRQTRNAKSKESQPSNEEIAQRAYELFLTRGACHGSDIDDWLEAERELQQTN